MKRSPQLQLVQVALTLGPGGYPGPSSTLHQFYKLPQHALTAWDRL